MEKQSDAIEFQKSGFGGSFSGMDRAVTSPQQLTIKKLGEIREGNAQKHKYRLDVYAGAFAGAENNDVTCWATSNSLEGLRKLKVFISSDFIGKTWDELINAYSSELLER